MLKETLSALLIFEILFFIFGGFTLFYLLLKYYQKQFDKQKKLTLMEQSNRLIETINSERREYQNNIQVMKIMVAMGVTRELDAYISKIISDMFKTSNIAQISDPILAATIISHQVKAKEYNIGITVNCKQAFNNFEQSLKLGELFNLFLDLLIENIITTKNLVHGIIINIEEEQTSCSFEFKTDDTIIISKNSLFNPFSTNISHSEKLTAAKKLVKELNGSFYSVIDNGRIYRLKVIIKKNRNIMEQFNSIAN